jgi:hypothetical protein
MRRILPAAALAAALLAGAPGLARAAALSLANQSMTAPAGTPASIPLLCDFAGDEHVRSVEVDLAFPWNWSVTGIHTAGSLLEGWNGAVEAQPTANLLTVAAAGVEDLAGTGTLLFVDVLVQGSGWMDLQSARLNEGSPVPTLTDGYFTLTVPSPLSVSPAAAQHLLPGETVLYTASGSPSPPLSWGVDNPATGAVSAGGLYTAQAQGLDRVRVVDVGGRSGAGGLITVSTFHLQPGAVSGMAGQEREVSLTLQNPSGAVFHSLALTLELGSPRLTVLGLESDGELLSAWSNLDWVQQGTQVSVAGTAPDGGGVDGAGVLFRLRLGSTTGAAFNHSLSLPEVRLDEEWWTRTATATGSWTATNSFTLSPQTATLLAGQTLQLQVVGTPNGPLTWTSLDPAVLTVGDSGLVSAVAGGHTRVTAVDPLGVGDTTGFLFVNDLGVAPASMGAQAGTFVLVPLQTGDLTGRGVGAWQFQLSYPATWLTFDGLETAGSLCQGWTEASWTLDGSSVTAAGVGPVLAGAGPLIHLRFWVDPAAPNNQTALLQLQEFIYNEGLPSVLRGNGTLTFGALAPVCSVQPASLDFGTLLPGSTAQASFTISNTGGGTLAGVVSEACDGFQVVSSPTYSLGPGQSQTFQVAFSGALAGSYLCTLDTGAPCGQDVSLAAAVVAVTPALGPSSACGVVDELGHLPGSSQGFVVDWEGGLVGLDLVPAPAANLRARVVADGVVVYDGASTSQWRASVVDLTPLLAQDVELHLELWDGVAAWNSGGSQCLWELAFLGQDGLGRPAGFALAAAPNPFNPSTRLAFTLPRAGQVRLDIHDLRGARVATLVDGPLPAGSHEARFGAGSLPSGVYVAVLQTDGHRLATKLLLAR